MIFLISSISSGDLSDHSPTAYLSRAAVPLGGSLSRLLDLLLISVDLSWFNIRMHLNSILIVAHFGGA